MRITRERPRPMKLAFFADISETNVGDPVAVIEGDLAIGVWKFTKADTRFRAVETPSAAVGLDLSKVLAIALPPPQTDDAAISFALANGRTATLPFDRAAAYEFLCSVPYAKIPE